MEPIELVGPSLPGEMSPALEVQEPVEALIAEEGATDGTLAGLIRAAILEAAPEKFVDEKHWGRQEERFSGLRVRGSKLSVRERPVNHGFWRRFSAHLLAPEQTLKLQILPFTLENDDRNGFDVEATVRARSDATFAFWTYGVKGLNGSVRSDATIRIQMRLLVTPQIQFDWNALVPQVGLDIRLVWLKLKVIDLDVHHLGFFGGWLAEQLGAGSRSAVNALVSAQEPRLASKLQRRLDRLKLAESPVKD